MNIAAFCEKIAVQRWLSKKLRLRLIKLLYSDFLNNHEFEIDYFGFQYQGNTRNLIDRKVLLSSCYECDLLAFSRDFLSGLTKPVCADIGANVGCHALFMSRYAERIHAFEPYELVRRFMQDKLSINDVHNVDIYPFALGLADEQKRFYSPPKENLGTGSFVKGFSSLNRPAETLPVRNGDILFRELAISRLDLIKMDVEGFEREVIAGLPQTLGQFRSVVIFESALWLQNALRSLEDLSSVFPENYRFHLFSHTGKRRYGHYRLKVLTQDLLDHRKMAMIVASPEERDIPLQATRGIFS